MFVYFLSISQAEVFTNALITNISQTADVTSRPLIRYPPWEGQILAFKLVFFYNTWPIERLS